jgi:hypothetical protein
MKVYTFSTGGCRDGIYLESLSLTKEGIKDLIQSYLSTEDFIVREVKFLLDKIEVNVYDIDLGDTEYKYFELVSFSVF